MPVCDIIVGSDRVNGGAGSGWTSTTNGATNYRRARVLRVQTRSSRGDSKRVARDGRREKFVTFSGWNSLGLCGSRNS